MLLLDRIMTIIYGYRMLNTTCASAVSSCPQGELKLFSICIGANLNAVSLAKSVRGIQEALIRQLKLGILACPRSTCIHRQACLPRKSDPDSRAID